LTSRLAIAAEVAFTRLARTPIDEQALAREATEIRVETSQLWASKALD